MHLDIRDHIFIIRTGHLKKTPYGFCRKERGSVKDLLDRYYQYTGADTNTILSCSHCHSHASCGPQSRCCSQTADCIIADKDHTCTQETYTGYDLCRHTGGIYLFYIVKTNMRDGFKGGIEIDEGILIAQELERLGAHALVLSGGFVSKAPMYVMRGEMPITSMTYYMKTWWLKYGVKLAGRFMIPKSPFREAYFLDDALEFRKALKLPLIYVGGLVARPTIEKVLDHGFEFVQMGRALINEPDFVNRMKNEGEERCGCDHTNYCSPV